MLVQTLRMPLAAVSELDRSMERAEDYEASLSRAFRVPLWQRMARRGTGSKLSSEWNGPCVNLTFNGSCLAEKSGRIFRPREMQGMSWMESSTWLIICFIFSCWL